MATATLLPNGDGTTASLIGTTNSSSGPFYVDIDEGTTSPTDADIVTFGASATYYVQFGDTPSDCVTITAITIKLRANKASKGNGSVGVCQLFQSNESTAITSSSVPTLTTTMTTYTLTPTITGATDKATWDTARLKITNGGSGFWDMAAVQIEITYSTTGGGVNKAVLFYQHNQQNNSIGG